MFGGGVTLLRSAARRFVPGVIVMATVVGASTHAAAATGGADLPGGGLPAQPAPAGTTAPAQEPATQVALVAPKPALPVLATQSRRPEDPVARDLAALIEPSPIAAISGHVVFTQPHMGRTELVDVGPAGDQRIVLSGTRVFGPPSAGLDDRNRPVAVISPCAGADEVVLQRQAPKCPLRVVDLQDGTSRGLASTTGALLGDIAGTTSAFTRRGRTGDARLYLSGADGVRAVPLPTLGKTGDGWLPAHGTPTPGSVQVTALDVGADGRLAAVIEYRSKKPVHSSSLWLRSAAGVWKRVTTLGTHFTGQGTRQVLAPQLDDDGGVRAYVEGIVETPSFAGHWTDDGSLAAKVSVRRSIGRATILHSAAYDADRLVFVDWLPGVPCGSEGALACGLRALGPVALG